MTSINPTDHKILEKIGLGAPQNKEISESDKNKQDFLKLFMAQLRNQDPMQPQEGAEFLGQLAQFSTVEGIQNLQKSFETLASSLHSSQALQASSLVGKRVQVNSDMGYLDNQGISGTIELPRSVSDLAVYIEDDKGQTIERLSLGTQAAGDVEFLWNGALSNGTKADPGVYKIKAQALINGKPESFKTYMFSNVDSVTLNRGTQGLTLNVSGYGSLLLSDVKKIG